MFSIVAPLDSIRLKQFKNTKRAYDKMPYKKEFIIPTRTIDEVRPYLEKHGLMKDVTLIPYTIEVGFNCSKALNIGVRNAQYPNVIITSPEVKPSPTVLEQLSHHLGENIICWVDDEAEDGKLTPLVTKTYRGDTPAMYFLAMFNKEHIYEINGWDEEFLKGYAYEDNDFGDRWVRAGLPFTVIEEIKAVHQFHPRSETIPGGLNINLQKYNENNENGVIRCKNGLNVVQ